MVLENFTFSSSTQSSLQLFINNRMIPKLKSIVDDSETPKPLCISVQTWQDVSHATDILPNSIECPECRIDYTPVFANNNQQAVTLFDNVNVDLYFIFNIDFPSDTFTILRDNYFKVILSSLKYNVFGDNAGFNYESWFKIDAPNTWILTHDAHYDGKNITPASDYSMSKLSVPVIVKHNLTAEELTLASS